MLELYAISSTDANPFSGDFIRTEVANTPATIFVTSIQGSLSDAFGRLEDRDDGIIDPRLLNGHRRQRLPHSAMWGAEMIYDVRHGGLTMKQSGRRSAASLATARGRQSPRSDEFPNVEAAR